MYPDTYQPDHYDMNRTYIIAIKLDWKPKNLDLPISRCEGIVTNTVNIDIFDKYIKLNTKLNMQTVSDTYYGELHDHFDKYANYIDDLRLDISEKPDDQYQQDSLLDSAFQCHLKSLFIVTDDVRNLCDLLQELCDLIELKITISLKPEQNIDEEGMVLDILNSLSNNHVIQHVTINSQAKINNSTIEQKALDLMYINTGLEICLNIDNIKLSTKKGFSISSRSTHF